MEEPDRVEFICRPEDEGVPAPEAASNVLPGWYKMLPTIADDLTDDHDFTERTVRLCPAFLDALSLGWIVPFEADIKVDAEGDGVSFDDGGNDTVSHREIGSGDYDNAVAGVEFHSSWAAKVPDGCSLLALSPMNRREQRFKAIGQVIDADQNLDTLDIPALWLADGAKTVIRSGSPMVQVIPFKRDSRLEEAFIRPFGNDGKRSYDRIQNKTAANRSWYREKDWEPKGTKVID